MSAEDKELIVFIYNRMINIYGENPNVDYMKKLSDFIERQTKPLDKG